MADHETRTTSTPGAARPVERIAGLTDTSLREQTDQLRTELNQWLPGEALDHFDQGAQETSRALLSGLVSVGDRAPDFRLPDARGGEVKLSSLLKSGPVVMVFYRGEWCPYCNLPLAAFQQALDEIEATGASLVAISPQTPDASLTQAEKHELRFAVLSDRRNQVATEYGLVIRQPDVTTTKQLEVEKELGINLDVTTFSGEESLEFPAVLDDDVRVRQHPGVLRDIQDHAGVVRIRGRTIAGPGPGDPTTPTRSTVSAMTPTVR